MAVLKESGVSSPKRAAKLPWRRKLPGSSRVLALESGGRGLTASGTLTVNGRKFSVKDLVTSQVNVEGKRSEGPALAG